MKIYVTKSENPKDWKKGKKEKKKKKRKKKQKEEEKPIKIKVLLKEFCKIQKLVFRNFKRTNLL